MRVSRYLKPLLKIGAKTVVAGLSTGGGPIGAIVGSVLADKLNIDRNDPKFKEKVAKAALTEEGRRKIMLAELELQSKKATLFNTLELKQLEVVERNFAQVQKTARTELLTKDKYISHTRPFIVRQLFKLAALMVFSMIGALVADLITDSILMNECLALKTEEDLKICLAFIDTRESYSTKISTMYEENWLWLSPLFGIFVAYFTGRTYEKYKGVAI